MVSEQVLSQAQTREKNILRNVYLWMAMGLAITGVVAWGIGSRPQMAMAVAMNPLLMWGSVIGQLALVWTLSRRLQSLSVRAAVLGFGVFALLNGVTLSVIFLRYSGALIFQAFFVAAAVFGSGALYGLVSKRPLSGIGQYLGMAIWGLILATLVNFFFRSTGLSMIISYAGVLIFTGLTAYETQVIKGWNRELGGSITEAQYIKLSITGALGLYLNFINIFLYLLRIFGGMSRD